MTESKFLKARCKKTNQYFGLEIKKFGATWKPKPCQVKFSYDLKLTDLLSSPHSWSKSTGKIKKKKKITGYYKPSRITDFDIGLKIPHSLKARQIKGGVVLIDSDWVMRPTTNVKDFFR